MQVQENLDRSMEVFRWNQRLMSTWGIWPETRNNLRFSFSFAYYCFLMFFEYLDLFYSANNFEEIVASLTENIACTQSLIRVTMLRAYNNEIGVAIAEAKKYCEMNNYKTANEREAAVSYNSKSRIFVKLLSSFMASTTLTYFLKPVWALLGKGTPEIEIAENETHVLYIFPYRFHVLYAVEDTKTYAFTYMIQFPFAFLAAMGHTASDCIMITLVYHICGQMSILSMRLKNLDSNSRTCRKEMRNVIQKHNNLLRIGKIVEDAFSITLLTHLVCATFLVCMLGYHILLNLGKSEKAFLITYVQIECLTLLILYVHCTVGENLLTESAKIREAFYFCKWYDMPAETARYIIFSMGREHKPICLSAGKFGIFCLNTFTEVVKTSMGYLSVLRTVL